MKTRPHRTTFRARPGSSGQAQVEYVLLLAVFGLPMVYVFGMLLAMLSSYYGIVTFFQTLPLP